MSKLSSQAAYLDLLHNLAVSKLWVMKWSQPVQEFCWLTNWLTDWLEWWMANPAIAANWKQGPSCTLAFRFPPLNWINNPPRMLLNHHHNCLFCTVLQSAASIKSITAFRPSFRDRIVALGFDANRKWIWLSDAELITHHWTILLEVVAYSC